MYNQDYDGSYDEPYPTPQPTSPTSGPVVGMTPVPGHPGLYYNTAGVVFDGTGARVDGYVNPATGTFQAGAPTTDPNTGIIGAPTPSETPTMPPVVETTPTPTPIPPPPPLNFTPQTTTVAPPPSAPSPPFASAPQPPTPIAIEPAPALAPAPGAPAPALAPAPTPSVTPPKPTPPPAFHYDEFVAPDPNDLSNDKAFQFENEQGMRAIGARNAALGTLNTGGTLKDYVTFGENLAHMRYGDLFDRALTKYSTNRGNAVQDYNTNYGTQYQDPWNESMQRASLDQNTNQFNATDALQRAGLDQNNSQFKLTKSLERAGLDQQNNQYNGNMAFNEWLEQYKRSTLDPFDQKYKTLSLL